MEQTKKHFLKNMVGFSMTAWISFVIGFIASPISTRLFERAELGKINMFNLYATLLASVCYLGLDQAFVRFYREPPGKSSRAGMFTFCAATSVGFGLLSSALLFFGWRGVSAQVVGEADWSVFLCLCLFSLCMVLFRYLSLSYRMEQNARLYTLQGVLYVVVTKIAYLAVGFGNAQGKAAILALTALTGLFTVVFALIQRRRFDPGFAAGVDRPFLREMALYAAPLIPMTLISWLNSSVSQIILRQLMGLASIGLYTSALTLASTVNIIQTGFNTYWAPYVYENYQSDNKSRFFTVHRLMACALTLFALGVTLLQDPVFLLLGPNYRSSVVFFPFLFLAPVCYCLSETTGMGVSIAKKTYWNTLIFLASVVLNLGLSALLIPPLGEMGAALASAAAAIAFLLLRTWAGERYYKAIDDYRYLAYAIGLMLAGSFGNWLLRPYPLAHYGLLAGVFALACFLFRREAATLWRTALQALREGRRALTRRAGTAPAEARSTRKEEEP